MNESSLFSQAQAISGLANNVFALVWLFRALQRTMYDWKKMACILPLVATALPSLYGGASAQHEMGAAFLT